MFAKTFAKTRFYPLAKCTETPIIDLFQRPAGKAWLGGVAVVEDDRGKLGQILLESLGG